LTTYNEDLKYWVSFTRIPGIGRIKIGLLVDYFSSLQNAWKAPVSEIRNAGIDEKTSSLISDCRSKINPDFEIETLHKHNVAAIPCTSQDYPVKLKEIHDFPPVLYICGNLSLSDENGIAVVGTRKASAYGRQVTEEIVSDLANNGISIISGLARGIDTIAHRAALEVSGRTLAVFACGLDIVYPAENGALAKRILENGALISEYPIGTKPKPEYFPRRNRIMSGLSLGVLVIEAGEKSGALITAEQALNQNREVFAVPGSIFSSYSKGTNRLIQQGAKLVMGYMDVLDEFNIAGIVQQLQAKECQSGDNNESIILQHLSHEPKHIDEICRCSKLSLQTVSSSLAMLELRGIIKQMGVLNYVLAKGIR
jgi:DNA processing protein